MTMTTMWITYQKKKKRNFDDDVNNDNIWQDWCATGESKDVRGGGKVRIILAMIINQYLYLSEPFCL